MTVDREPGVYQADAAERAAQEQRRSEIRDLLRTSQAYAAVVMAADGSVTESVAYMCPDEDPEPFLLLVAVMAVRNLAAVTGDAGAVLDLVADAIERGAGA